MPFVTMLNRMRGRVVVQVCILALILVGCGDSESVVGESQDLIAAADSAERAVWGEIAVIRSDSIRPSALFDTAYKYLLPAVLIEREKRTITDSFARKTVLAVDRLQTKQQRLSGITTIRTLEKQDSLWNLRVDSLQRRYASSIHLYLDFADVDSTERQGIIDRFIRRERFIPRWRDELDSLIREMLQTQREIIHFIDTASHRIKIEGALQFTEASDMVTYQSFTAKLEQLAIAQGDALQASYMNDRSRPNTQEEAKGEQASESTTANDSLPAQKVHSWPQAVKIR